MKKNEIEINTENNLKNTSALATITPLEITPAVFLAAFGPGPYRLRSFCDRGGGPGQNVTVESPADPAFAAVLAELHRVNQAERRGIFFVVNAGGHRDAEITRVTAHFVEADDLPLETQWDNLMAFPLPPSIVVRTRKSLHGYWLLKDKDGAGRLIIAPTNRELTLDQTTDVNHHPVGAGSTRPDTAVAPTTDPEQSIMTTGQTLAPTNPEQRVDQTTDVNHHLVGAGSTRPDSAVAAIGDPEQSIMTTGQTLAPTNPEQRVDQTTDVNHHLVGAGSTRPDSAVAAIGDPEQSIMTTGQTLAPTNPEQRVDQTTDVNHHPVGAGSTRPDSAVAPTTDPNLTHFRTIQKQLAAHFGGDPVIANPSRVMRLPGFDHHKAEPVAVVCLLFEPGRRYTQAELAATLAKLHPEDPRLAVAAAGPGPQAGRTKTPPVAELTHSLADFDLAKLLSSCDFIRHCQEQAATLPEPLWYPMITNLADLPGGEAAIQRLSSCHPGYSPAATAAKIAQYRRSGTAPFTCETIQAWGFACPKLGHCEAHQPRDLGKLPLPPWYTRNKRGLRLIPGVLANALAKHKRVIYARQCYFQYHEGVYKQVDELHCKRIVRKYLRADHVEMHQINDVHNQWTIEILKRSERLNLNKDVINLKNGLYELASRRLIAHDPQIFSTIQLAVPYQPQTPAPIFAAFLNDCLDPATQLLVQELCGYLLVPETRAQKAFVLVGEGGAGKSTLLLVLQELLLGRENVSNISWQSLGEKFLTAELEGRLANIFADLPSKNIDDSNLFKSITGEDWLTVQRKNKDPYTFKATARLVFSCNSIPKNLGDRSEAFYRRLVIVPFAPPKPVAQRDLHLKDKLESEAPGILNWALAGLERLIDNGYRFSESPASQAALASYRVAGSSVLSFVEDCCEVEGPRQISAATLYHGYQQYTAESGLRAVSQKRFWMELKESFKMVEKVKEKLSRRTIYQGIDLVEGENFGE